MEPDISVIAGLIGEQARSRMLTALMSGKALTATELSLVADISAQTASSHLAKLVEGQLLVVRKQGRHKYFQLQGAEVAQVLEHLISLSADLGKHTPATGPGDPVFRHARVCYDHLAGELGVNLYDALARQGHIIDEIHDTRLTEQGKHFFTGLGVDFSEFRKQRRPLCKSCLDWSERRNHLAGQLGQWILNDIFARNWAKYQLDSRAIAFSDNGRKAFYRQYQLI